MQVDLYTRQAGFNGQRIKDAPYFGRPADAVRSILFGLMVVSVTSAMNTVMLPYPQRIELSGALGASNVLAGKVVIDGTENAVTVTYSGSHSATMTSLANTIKALNTTKIVDCVVDGNNLYVKAEAYSEVYFKDFAVTGGSAVTVVHDIQRKLMGVAEEVSKERNSDGTTVKYNHKDIATIGVKGAFLMQCEDTAIDPGIDDVYVRIIPEADKQVGAIKKSSDSGKAILVSNAQFLKTNADGMVEVLFS